MVSLQAPRVLFSILLAIIVLPITNGFIVDDITTSFIQAEDCDSCRDLLGSFQTIALNGDDAFVSNFVSLCTELQVEDPDVCNGTFSALGPIIARDLRQINVNGTTAEKLCDALFGLCSTSTAIPFTDNPEVKLYPLLDQFL